MKKLCLLLATLFFMGGTLCAQTLKQQNQKLKNQNAVLTDSIRNLALTLDSVSRLRVKLAEEYRILQTRYQTSGGQSDSLLRLSRLQASEIYALQVTNDSLNRRLESLLAEKSQLMYYVDSLSALQEKKEERKNQKELWGRNGWRNLSYSFQKMDCDLYQSTLKPDYAFGFAMGQTFYLHKKPIANMIRFGLDWSYIDLNIAQYSDPSENLADEDGSVFPSDGMTDGWYGYAPNRRAGLFDGLLGDEEEVEGVGSMYKMEAAMLFGPSITINPIDHLMIQAYFRYAPTYSMLLDGDMNYYGTYASFFNAGVTLSYKMIGIGVESRWGNTTYSQDVYNAEADDYESRDIKWRTKGLRLYLSFRF